MKKTKKAVSLAAALLLALSLTACGKSEEAQAVDDQIAAIGTVSLDSEDAIAAAEDALSGLSEEDREQVENQAVLEEARTTYEDLVKQSQADEVDAAIAAIGEVTLDSGDAIAAARQAYDGAAAEIQALVQGAADLEAAEAKLDELQIAEASDAIAAIGEVTMDSGDAIDAAKTAYNGLTADQQSRVANAGDLTAAEEQLKELKRARTDELLAGMTKDEDPFQGVSFYYPSGWRFYSDGSWVADESSFIRPYLGVSEDSAWIRVIYNYTGDDWVFFTKLTVLADGETYHKSFNYFDIVRDNSGGVVWEYIDDDGTGDEEMLWAIANSSEAMIRFEGDDYVSDYTVRDSDKEIIRQTLEAYEALQ